MCPTQIDSRLLPLGTRDDYVAVRFVIDLVDRLGVEHGFDPAELINPRTQEPFGPFIRRMRTAIRLFEASSREDRPKHDGGRL